MNGAALSLARGVALVAFCWVAIALELAPRSLAVKPDLLFCVAAGWALARPGRAPLTLIFAAGLLRDLLTDAPVGAGALGLVVGVALLQSQAATLAARGLLATLLGVGAALLVAVMLPCALLLLTLAPVPDASAVAARLLLTAALFPPVALLLRRRPDLSRTGAVDNRPTAAP